MSIAPLLFLVDLIKQLVEFIYDTSRCMICGLCEDSRPSDALVLTQDYEAALNGREGFILNRGRLEKGPEPTVYAR